MKHYLYLTTPLGELTVCEEHEQLTRICWDRQPAEGIFGPTPLLRETAAQMEAYFAHRLTRFTLPCHLEGSDFQILVWKEMSRIPYGKTWSYQELARQCGPEKACQAVGTACRKNPIALIIPCHRVINKNGAPGNYNGGAERKRLLLAHENPCGTLFPLSVINL